MLFGRCSTGWLVGLAVLLGTQAAWASMPDSDWDGDYDQKAERRSDFTFGLFNGFVLGAARGYPNELEKIDQSKYESRTGLGMGSGGGGYLGVAFNDYFTFGIGTMGFNVKDDDLEASGGGLIFHVEAFPLFRVAPALRDLAIFADFGAGGASIEGGPETADGGLMSMVSLGAAYEPWRLWRFAFGPSASYTHMWSSSLTLKGAMVGLRVAFYGGP